MNRTTACENHLFFPVSRYGFRRRSESLSFKWDIKPWIQISVIFFAATMTFDICIYCSIDDPDRTLWVQCDHCPQWVHVDCIPSTCLVDENLSNVGKVPTNSRQIISFTCDKHGKALLQLKGKSSNKRSSSEMDESRPGLRKKKHIDYIALNEGQDKRLKDEHPHVPNFLKCFKKWQNTTNVISSKDLSETFGNITVPLKVIDPENSGMKVPSLSELKIDLNDQNERMTVETITRVLGDDYKLDVMDVQTQQNSTWTMAQWNEYFSHTSAEKRDRIYNVISLEVSHIKEFENGIRRPKAVETNDLVDIVWGGSINNAPRPKVTKYILMSVQNAFTDFHLDFAGTSVYYKVVSGAKKFILFPPSDHNLSEYRNWCDNDEQNLIFLGERLHDGIAMDLREGDLFMIPCGYIHAVYTPADSLVIGGNFLTLRDLKKQLQIVNVERLTKVPKKFTFPSFDAVMGRTLEWILTNKELSKISPDHLKALMQYMSDPKVKYKPLHFHNKSRLLNELNNLR